MKTSLFLMAFLLLPLAACLQDTAYDITCTVPAAQCKGQERSYSSDPCGKPNAEADALKRAAATCQELYAKPCGAAVACVCKVKAVRPKSCSLQK